MKGFVTVALFLRWCRMLFVLTAMSLGGYVFGQTSDDEEEPESPVRPDLSQLSPEQATTAMEKYNRAVEEWERVEAPRREEQYRKAIEAAAVRKAERERKEAERERLQGSVEWQPPEKTTKVEVAADYDWESEGRAQGLTAATLAQLKRDFLVIAGPDYPQVFSVYESERIVPFVTSDSLLNGFHVLLEASLKKFELRRSAQLREVLEGIVPKLDRRLAEEKVPRALAEPFIRHLARVTGPALRLLGSTKSLGDPALEADVDAVVAKIKAAQAVELPEWMGPPEPGLLAIDFRRCRPIGFYTDSTALADYYRAVRWLQLVPLRAARDHEVGAAALMAELSSGNQGSLSLFVEQGEEIWGKEDGATISQMASGAFGFLEKIALDGNAKQAILSASERIVLFSKLHPTRMNDQLRAASGPGTGAAVRVLAGAVLPDALFLNAIASKRPSSNAWPQGMEVAAWLGSDFALRKLEQDFGKELPAAVTSERDRRTGRMGYNAGVPELYYDVLRSLFEPADPAAPALVNTDAWQRKSVQTALAGWAQLRHSWELQTKQILVTVGVSMRPAGFIEPNPIFFQRMCRLETALVTRFQRAGVFAKVAADEIEFLRGELRKLERLGCGKIEVGIDDIDSFESDDIIELIIVANQTDGTIDFWGWRELRGEAQIEYWGRIIELVKERIGRLERGEHVPPLDSRTYRNDADQQMFDRWQSMQTMTARLEAMVQKQLRGADWNEGEAALIRNYGDELGEIMGYLADASAIPKDDAPRWTTVFYDPISNQNLAVAIGRPRALYVLYPWKGKTILCRGAVMSYYEYPSEKRLTDPEWKRLLGSPEAPAQPEWIRPLVAPVTKKH